MIKVDVILDHEDLAGIELEPRSEDFFDDNGELPVLSTGRTRDEEEALQMTGMQADTAWVANRTRCFARYTKVAKRAVSTSNQCC